MNRLIYGIFAVILGTLLSACGIIVDSGDGENSGNSKNEANSENSRNEVIKISPEDAIKRLESEEGIMLVDVRTQEEYDQEHIPGSILIPVDVIEKEAPVQLEDKDAVIFIYCRSGRRSAAAAKTLVKMGYQEVYDLGGIIDWPYKTESGR